MRISVLTLAFLAALTFSACEKCADCKCTNNYTFDWDDDVTLTDAEKEEIENKEKEDISRIYEESEDEICYKKKDLDDRMESWGEKRSFEQTYEDWRYTLLLEHDCACTEQN